MKTVWQSQNLPSPIGGTLGGAAAQCSPCTSYHLELWCGLLSGSLIGMLQRQSILVGLLHIFLSDELKAS